MRELILHPTDLSQWYALVNEAEGTTGLVLTEHTESYLVFLLMRFSQVPKLMESVVALDFLNSRDKPRQIQRDLLREVGDKSLLFCGLFPGMARRRNVNLSYFSDMGKAAYLTIGELQDHPNAELYFQLSAHFINLQKILQAMRGEFLQINGREWAILNTSMQ